MNTGVIRLKFGRITNIIIIILLLLRNVQICDDSLTAELMLFIAIIYHYKAIYPKRSTLFVNNRYNPYLSTNNVYVIRLCETF